MRPSARLACLTAPLLLAWTAATAPAAPQTHGDDGSSATLFRSVRLLSMERRGALESADVLVRGGTVAAVGKAGTVLAPSGARIVEGRGRTLLPGLVDSHVHVEQEDVLPLFLAHGVTTVRNMAGIPAILRWRAEVARGERLGPTIVTATPSFDGVDYGMPQSFHAATPEAARQAVRDFAAQGFDWVKVVRLSDDTFEAVLEEARKVGLPVGGHLHSLERPPLDILSAGMASSEHIVELAWSAFHGSTDHAAIPTFVDGVRRAGTTVCTLLASGLVAREMVADGVAFLAGPFPDLLRRYRSKDGLENARGYIEAARGWAAEDRQRRLFDRRFVLDLLAALHRGGVPVVPGTDAQSFVAVAGLGLHDELALFVEAGLTPWEALRAATWGAAGLLGTRDHAGTVAPGKDADLVLVDGNPLVDLDTLRRPAGVMLRGRWLDAAELAALRP